MRLLIGGCEGRLQTVIAQALRAVGYRVDIAESGAELRTIAAGVNYELIILDASLADAEETGATMVCALRREGFRAPILVTCSNGAVDRLVAVLDSGADDCLVKPFNNRELLARVRALLRRPPSIPRSILSLGDIEADEGASEVRCFGRPTDLRLRERQLLAILLRQKGNVVPKETLVRALSGYSCEISANAIEALVSRIRRRLRAIQSGIVIVTVHGIGYRLSHAAAQYPVAPKAAV